MKTQLVAFACLSLLIFIATGETNKGEGRRDHCNKTVDLYEDVTSPDVSPSNFGLPMSCWYRFRTFKTHRDWVVRIRFKKFKVGSLMNATNCEGGYLQIIDGSAKSDLSNRREPGKFCGELEQTQTFISETNSVRLHFYTDNFTDQTYFSFDTRAEQQVEIYRRYGQHPELYPNRRGQVVPGTYCERVFRDCKLQTCYVQSPAYPGVYPRHLHCRYKLNTNLPFIKLYIENEDFNVDGQRCENIMTCPMRPITSVEKNCPYDYIRIYDGENETNPVIGTFCGMGKFPYSIVGTGADLLVEFVTSAAGPLLNTGFHFNVGNWPGNPELAGEKTSTCDWTLTSQALHKSGKTEGIFLSIAHWYPPQTTCTYLIQGERDQIVRLYFPSFRINRVESPIVPYSGDCAESLTLYDSDRPDDSKIIKTFCDTFSRAMEKHDFVSTGNSLFVRFESKTGSYSGSSLYYWAHYDFHNNTHFGEPIPGTVCDETFTAWRSSEGTFRSPLNTLVFKPGGSSIATQQSPPLLPILGTGTTTRPYGYTSGLALGSTKSYRLTPTSAPIPTTRSLGLAESDIKCTYRFVTDARLYARILLFIESLNFKDNPFHPSNCTDCWTSSVDKLLIWEPKSTNSSDLPPNNKNSNGTGCLCKRSPYGSPSDHQLRQAVRVVSTGERLGVQLSVEGSAAASSYFKQPAPLFTGRYHFVHGPLCGPAHIRPATDGTLVFPHLDALGYTEPPKNIHCIWDLQVHPDRDLELHFDKVKFPSNECEDGRLEIFIPGRQSPFVWACGKNAHVLKDVPTQPALELSGRVQRLVQMPTDQFDNLYVPGVRIVLTSSTTPTRTAFTMTWTELFPLLASRSPQTGRDPNDQHNNRQILF